MLIENDMALIVSLYWSLNNNSIVPDVCYRKLPLSYLSNNKTFHRLKIDKTQYTVFGLEPEFKVCVKYTNFLWSLFPTDWLAFVSDHIYTGKLPLSVILIIYFSGTFYINDTLKTILNVAHFSRFFPVIRLAVAPLTALDF